MKSSDAKASNSKCQIPNFLVSVPDLPYKEIYVWQILYKLNKPLLFNGQNYENFLMHFQ
jgi:hypothetical protein